MTPDREPTEAEWAAVGRYLLGRLKPISPSSPGVNLYCLDDGWPYLVGPNAVSAVMRAIVAEDDERKRMEGER